ncbi:hypothetical protein M9H77_24598 [Catharanthus roseus]|uniref:Uncharacterized protein n=1 Tax=Catharanthus roseus TaxID=4058 RepID=A0ACC0AWN7_CATRO|nr:hypothetical protein M9H77_24598 [Catharanthus roseus]
MVQNITKHLVEVMKPLIMNELYFAKEQEQKEARQNQQTMTSQVVSAIAPRWMEFRAKQLNSCTSRLTSSPDAFKGKKIGGRPRRAFTLQDSSLSPRDRIAFGLEDEHVDGL